MAHPRQTGFFDGNHPKAAHIVIRDKHELVLLTDAMPWSAIVESAMDIRASRIKGNSGPEPHYRELLGAVTLMAVRSITYRQAEDLIAHYAPARYLCGLMDSTWQPDHITIFEFTQMLGPEGMDVLNKRALLHAQSLGVLDASRMMSDTTAQEFTNYSGNASSVVIVVGRRRLWNSRDCRASWTDFFRRFYISWKRDLSRRRKSSTCRHRSFTRSFAGRREKVSSSASSGESIVSTGSCSGF